jgi:hypothetical protein
MAGVTEPDDRPHTPKTADEPTTLSAFLDRYRATLEWKCRGLQAAQLGTRSVPPSELTLLGLVRHLGEVESWWFRRWAGEAWSSHYPDSGPGCDFDAPADDPAAVEEAFAYWRGEVAHARGITMRAASLDEARAMPQRPDQPFSLRWILVHMIEEYARHCGHADLLRERIDGVTGD